MKVAGLTKVTLISGRLHHNLALRSDGTVWAWGSNLYGLLGKDPATIANSFTPVKLPAGASSNAIIQLAPFRVMLNPGAKLIFPNPEGLPAGSKVTLWTLDQDVTSATVGSFVPAGQAMVSSAGRC